MAELLLPEEVEPTLEDDLLLLPEEEDPTAEDDLLPESRLTRDEEEELLPDDGEEDLTDELSLLLGE